ncbi:MAG: hypothetical protein COB04_03935 [Gammaproteobacteria bacterium]|nr:MAG: hypothetical protein COB04_03935 [Gammaproteobacteria bacterium]
MTTPILVVDSTFGLWEFNQSWEPELECLLRWSILTLIFFVDRVVGCCLILKIYLMMKILNHFKQVLLLTSIALRLVQPQLWRKILRADLGFIIH